MKKPISVTVAVLLALILISARAYAQTLYLVKSGSSVKMQIKVRGVLTDQPPEALKKIRPSKHLRIDFSGLAADATVKFHSTPDASTNKLIPVDGNVIELSGKQYIFKKTDPTIKILKISVVSTAGATEANFVDIGADVASTSITGTDVDASYASWREYLATNHGGYLDIIKGRQRYFSSKNLAYICLDPFGNIIGKKPVNLDQDDDIIILMVVPNTEDHDSYSINDNDAEYAPSDLSIRPIDAILVPSIQSGEKSDVTYTIKVFDKGPYTSSNVTFTAMLGATMLSNTTVHVNPLHHLALGVSYVSSGLESPDYNVVPLTSTTNTIKAVNGGRRTFLTINAIWYWWSTLRYLQGSDITRGRDVLKEPNLITRINPTFGIGLRGKLENNLFAGFNFEFARGGSISAGWHYGKVNTLLDENFQLGITEFTEQQTDIKTFERWKWSGFFGITLDSRIFNKLFSSTKSSTP